MIIGRCENKDSFLNFPFQPQGRNGDASIAAAWETCTLLKCFDSSYMIVKEVLRCFQQILSKVQLRTCLAASQLPLDWLTACEVHMLLRFITLCLPTLVLEEPCSGHFNVTSAFNTPGPTSLHFMNPCIVKAACWNWENTKICRAGVLQDQGWETPAWTAVLWGLKDIPLLSGWELDWKSSVRTNTFQQKEVIRDTCLYYGLIHGVIWHLWKCINLVELNWLVAVVCVQSSVHHAFFCFVFYLTVCFK